LRLPPNNTHAPVRTFQAPQPTFEHKGAVAFVLMLLESSHQPHGSFHLSLAGAEGSLDNAHLHMFNMSFQSKTAH
jgi:hypothetical protein